jgi:transposase
MEVCGFNDWLIERLPRWGCKEVIVVQPEERLRQKTDRRDANRLSELLWINRQRLLAGLRVRGMRRVHISTPAEREDRRLTALRRSVGADLTRVINAVKHILRRHNLEQSCPTKGIQTDSARKWLRTLKLLECDRLELDQLLARWGLLQEQRDELDKRIESRQGGNKKAGIVASIFGAGAYTSLGIASRVGPIDRFPRPRSLANYFGVTPGSRNSGKADKRLGSITKQGSAMVRFLLGQLVLHVLRRDPQMRQWYKGIRKRRGSKIARVAVMRRLVTIIWHMLKKNEGYMPGGPPRARLAATAGR